MLFETPEEYMEQTEHAVRHYYAGLDSCRAVYQEANRHWDLSRINDPPTPERSAAIQRYLNQASKYFNLKFSEASFAGSILQVAHMGIRCFSRNEIIPPSCSRLVTAGDKPVIPFCVGQEVHGIPCGLIIYAARNQYNHWDEKPHPVTARVFDALSTAFSNDMLSDLAFDVGNPLTGITNHASEVLLTALRWTTYTIYQSEMSQLLQG